MALKLGDSAARSLTRSGLAVVISLIAVYAFAQVATEPSTPPATAPVVISQQPASIAVPSSAPAPKTVVKAAPVTSKASAAAVHPLWNELTPAQKLALTPLAAEWDALDGFRKKKWLEIGAKYSTMKPDEQQRMQERMREWAKLTPDQRRVARESFARTKKLDAQQKSAQWEKYQQLPDEQKKKLAADASAKTPVARLPSEQNNKSKTVPPIKATPKPVLEKSVTPQATNQSDIGPSPLPENK